VHYLTQYSSDGFSIISLILTLTGKSNVLITTYFPAIDLSDDDYELGLMNFETYNTISNVNASNNKFYFGENDVEIILEGSYELHAIWFFETCNSTETFATCDKFHDDKKRGSVDDKKRGSIDDNVNEDFPIALRANNNTMKNEIKCIYRINFSKPNNIGSLLGFSSYITAAKMARIGLAH